MTLTYALSLRKTNLKGITSIYFDMHQLSLAICEDFKEEVLSFYKSMCTRGEVKEDEVSSGKMRRKPLS